MNYKKQKISSDDLSKEPLVSIIIPVYNAEKYIKQTILSVQEQTYKNWELLIIDNCSDDSTLQVITAYQDSQIRIYRTERNSGGPAVPRNIGIKNANGKFLAFLDADDLWIDIKLEVQLPYLKKHDFVSSLASIIDAEGKVTNQAECVENKHYEFCDMVKRNRVIHSSVIVSRDKFLTVMFDEDPLLNGIEDSHAYLTFALQHGRIFVIGESLIEHRFMMSSLGNSILGEQRLTKSIYCVSKVTLANGKYKCYLSAILWRLLSYFKKRLLN